MRFLYVEDDITTAKIVGKLLRQAGFDFETVYYGQDAVKKLKRHRYDLVLLDIMLTDTDGYEVIQRTRKAGIEIPFIIQTGLLDRARMQEGVSLGVAEYLIKPFNRDELVAEINKVLHRTSQISRSSLTIVDSAQPRKSAKEEMRDYRRFNTLNSVRVVRPMVFDCVMLNMSYGGAALQLPHPARGLLSRFSLDVYTGPVLECEICWRAGDKVGVRFI